MSPNAIANVLSTHQRQCLIDHAKGPQPFLAVGDGQTNGLRATKQCLIDMKLLCSTSTHLDPRPSELRLTVIGQEVVCILLGKMIDTLVNAGFMDVLTARKVFIAIDDASLVGRRGRPSKCTERNMPYHAVATPAEGPAQSMSRDRAATDELARRLAAGS